MPTITLTTDFGDGSSYVAAMKGDLLSVNPAARLVNLSHTIPPQNLVAAAYFLADTLPWFPPRTIHVVVVDPGVGTNRAILCVEWSDQVIVVPDNGCWTAILRPTDQPPGVYRLEERRFWRAEVSATFHGRDVFAPVAGHLSLGVAPSELGSKIEDWVRLELPSARAAPDGIHGKVIIVDRFGNLISNILPDGEMGAGSVQIDGRFAARLVNTYGDAEPGTLVALIGSAGRLEIAVVNGSAADRLGLGLGSEVEFRRDD